MICHGGGRGAFDTIAQVRPEAVLVDLGGSEGNGLRTLRAIRKIRPTCAVILMMDRASADMAVEAVQLGALGYLAKPLDFDRPRDHLTTVEKSIERRRTLMQIDADLARRFEFHGMIGRSTAMQELFDAVRWLAPHVRTVLITGETGTGEELVARAFHAVGPRRDRRWCRRPRRRRRAGGRTARCRAVRPRPASS